MMEKVNKARREMRNDKRESQDMYKRRKKKTPRNKSDLTVDML